MQSVNELRDPVLLPDSYRVAAVHRDNGDKVFGPGGQRYVREFVVRAFAPQVKLALDQSERDMLAMSLATLSSLASRFDTPCDQWARQTALCILAYVEARLLPVLAD